MIYSMLSQLHLSKRKEINHSNMNEQKLIEMLVESGVPEDKVQEMVDAFKQNTTEFERQHDEGINEPIDLGGGVYLSHLLATETDWRKRAAIAAAIASRNLGA